ncbi:MAG: slipin family protein [Pseudobdellovibrionaceae bacterium]|nr:slipin family protein [Pseudobdellovibrionaceae bacterium]
MELLFFSPGSFLFIFIIAVILFNSIKIVNQYERGVIFRLGKVLGAPREPGLNIVIPIIDKMIKIDIRTLTFDVPAQDIITRDNVTLKVNAVVYFRVIDPLKAVNEVENYLFATSQLAQTTLRSVLGQVELDELLSRREILNQKLQQILDSQTLHWGIKVSNVEVKQIDLPPDMQRAMARQAEAERERRAKVIAAEGEYQAASQLGLAAQELTKNHLSLSLRYLQTLKEVSQSQNNSVIVFPFPTELLKFISELQPPTTNTKKDS